MKNSYICIASIIFILLQQTILGQGIPCNPNTFWALNSSLQIVEYELNNGVVTSNGIIVSQSVPSTTPSLAFSNNMNGGAFSPTFYTNSGGDAAYYDGMAWVTTVGSPDCALKNAGGNGDYLYYHFNATAPYCIERYEGNYFYIPVYTDSTAFSVADMAVDDEGNIWSFVGTPQQYSDHIRVISPNGNIIKEYAFNFYTGSGYGCFLLNDILYVGFGPSHPTWPSKLLPITFTANTAIPGTPIDFFADGASDLASCNAGSPLALSAYNLETDKLNVYPTIATEFINCSVELSTGSNIEITIIDELGKAVYRSEEQVNAVSLIKIDVSALLKGIYFVQVDTGKEKIVRKFLK